jgi:cystathionine beta-lyase
MTEKPLGDATRISHAGRPGIRSHAYVNTPLVRGSTLLHPNVALRLKEPGHERALGYGIGGTPTHHALEDAILAIEGGTRCQIVGSGLTAATLPLLAYLSAGDHCLIPDSVYGPTRCFCDGMLTRFGVAVTYYHPTIDAAGLRALMRPTTRVLYVESPGSNTFEMQDVPALAAAAHEAGAKVVFDNTWGMHFFQPFTHGVDVSIVALTKYVGGHSDLLLGSITTATDEDYATIRNAAMEIGEYASPDDCWLALRGVRSMLVRLRHQMQAGLKVAAWLADRPEVLQVLHPALPGATGHDIWKRDYTGACSLFSVVLQPHFTYDSLLAMIDGLTLFGIGSSWGGYESLVLPVTGTITRLPGQVGLPGPTLRLHIGLEDTDDLIANLAHGLTLLRRE